MSTCIMEWGGKYLLHRCSFSLNLACYTEFSIRVMSYTVMGCYYHNIKQSCKICTKQLEFVKYLN